MTAITTGLHHDKKKEIKNIYFSSLRTRLIEEALAKEYFKQEIRTPIHLSIGQEFVASSICNFLSKDDFVISHHRSHAHYFAKNGSLNKFFWSYMEKGMVAVKEMVDQCI